MSCTKDDRQPSMLSFHVLVIPSPDTVLPFSATSNKWGFGRPTRDKVFSRAETNCMPHNFSPETKSLFHVPFMFEIPRTLNTPSKRLVVFPSWSKLQKEPKAKACSYAIPITKRATLSKDCCTPKKRFSFRNTLLSPTARTFVPLSLVIALLPACVDVLVDESSEAISTSTAPLNRSTLILPLRRLHAEPHVFLAYVWLGLTCSNPWTAHSFSK